ncbi:MAG TPA: DUF4410 domain-containing protein [Thermoanaerobaculia bacterium]|jgi:hypothetical protein|nr:DUF4410 domain-containing protein [Thermoanaerobaculia bacterium]
MKKSLLLLLLAVAVAAPMQARGRKSSSIEPGKYKEWGPDIDQIEIVKPFRLADYRTISVEPFDTAKAKLPDRDDNSYDAAAKVLWSSTEGVVQGLRGSVEQRVAIDERPGNEAGALILKAKVTVMDPGSRAARYWAGFGAGAARAEIEGELIDAATGETLLRFTQQRRSGVGVYGGDYQELMQRNLNAIGEDVAAMLKMF